MNGVTGVETDEGRSGYQRVVRESNVQQCIGYDQRIVMENGMTAKGNVSAGLAGIQTDAGHEPLTFVIDETHQ